MVGAAGGEIGGLLAPFTPFTAILYSVNPKGLFSDTSGNAFAQHATAARILLFVGSAIAATLYAAIIFSLYRPLVRNFDMIMRKQSGT